MRNEGWQYTSHTLCWETSRPTTQYRHIRGAERLLDEVAPLIRAEALLALAVEFDKQAAEWDTPMPIPEGWDSHHIIVRGATQTALVNAAKAARKAAGETS